jgi:hypothetical protein
MECEWVLLIYMRQTLPLWKTLLIFKVLWSEGVQRGVLGSAFDVCFAENVACMVKLWCLATGRVSRVK